MFSDFIAEVFVLGLYPVCLLEMANINVTVNIDIKSTSHIIFTALINPIPNTLHPYIFHEVLQITTPRLA
jgi:hypothetical protein